MVSEFSLLIPDSFAGQAGKIVLDGGISRIGIRLAEFKGKESFWLNGKPYGQLIGTNRHRDFAYVGNALATPSIGGM